MKTLARILTGVVALFFLGFGLAFLINPDAVIGQVSISAVGIAGMSTIRANMAGAFATAGIFLAIAAIMARKNALLAPGVFLAVVVIGRILGLVIDGSDPQAIQPLVLEILFLAIVTFAHTTFGKSENVAVN